MALAACIMPLAACSDDDETTSSSTSTTTSSSKATTDGTYFLTTGTNAATVDSSLDDGCVSVVWSGGPTVTIASSLDGLVEAYINGEYVSLIATADLQSEMTVTLSGTSTDGGFYMDGDYDAKFILNGLSLTATDDTPALFIQDGQKAKLKLASGTTNTFADASGGSQKACIMLNGHTVISGSGTLNVTGNANHAIWTDEYLCVENGTVNVKGAQTDGMNINQYFQITGGNVTITSVGDDGIAVAALDDSSKDNDGEVLIDGGTLTVNVTAAASKGIKSEADMTITDGTVNVNTSGTGAYDTDEQDTKACACLKTDANFAISGGTLTLTSTGAGGKGINADGNINIYGGTINVKTTGKTYTYGSASSDAKGIKCDGDYYQKDGDVNVSATGGEGSEGVETKSAFTIDGGKLIIKAYDDAINSGDECIINGGYVYAYSTGNDGIDSNYSDSSSGTAIGINGGVVFAMGTSSPEGGLDCDKGYIKVTGGYLFTAGGQQDSPNVSATQPTAYFGSYSLSSTYYYTLVCGTTKIFTVKAPANISQNYTMLSGEGMTTGTTCYLYYGTTAPTASTAAYTNGTSNCFWLSPTVTTTSTVKSWTQSSAYTTSATNNGGGGNPGGGPGR